jgi:hypothetical protein
MKIGKSHKKSWQIESITKSTFEKRNDFEKKKILKRKRS